MTARPISPISQLASDMLPPIQFRACAFCPNPPGPRRTLRCGGFPYRSDYQLYFWASKTYQQEPHHHRSFFHSGVPIVSKLDGFVSLSFPCLQRPRKHIVMSVENYSAECEVQRLGAARDSFLLVALPAGSIKCGPYPDCIASFSGIVVPSAEIAIHPGHSARLCSPWGFPVREDVSFTDIQGVERGGDVRWARRAIEKLQEPLRKILEPDEAVLYIARGQIMPGKLQRYTQGDAIPLS